MIPRRRRISCCCARSVTLWLLIVQQCHDVSVLWVRQPTLTASATTNRAAFSHCRSSSSPGSSFAVQTNRRPSFSYHSTQRIPRRRLQYQIGRTEPCSSSSRSTAIRQSDHAEDEHEPSHLQHHQNQNQNQHQNQQHRRSFTIPSTRIVSSLVSRIRRRGRGNNGTTSVREKQENCIQVVVSPKEVARMQRENLLLRGALQRLEVENERLHRKMARSLVLESFEGEGALWDAAANPRIFNGKNQTMDYDSLTTVGGAGAAGAARGGLGGVEAASSLASPFTTTTMTSEELLAQEAALWCDDDMADTCPVEPDVSFGEALRDRAYWLVGLLALQSCSGLILAHNEALIQHHPFIVYFLTMLVGAGGNAGNQASVRVIRGLALGTLNEVTQTRFLAREFKMAVALSCILSVAGFVRAAAFKTPFPETVALSVALFLIVSTSVCLGAILPIGLKRIGIDPAHSSTTIQVIMDILGVVLAVVVSSWLLDTPVGSMLIARLGG